MSKTIITISREFGSGGRSIGKSVAEALEIPCLLYTSTQPKALYPSGYTSQAPYKKYGSRSSGVCTTDFH